MVRGYCPGANLSGGMCGGKCPALVARLHLVRDDNWDRLSAADTERAVYGASRIGSLWSHFLQVRAHTRRHIYTPKSPNRRESRRDLGGCKSGEITSRPATTRLTSVAPRVAAVIMTIELLTSALSDIVTDYLSLVAT